MAAACKPQGDQSFSISNSNWLKYGKISANGVNFKAESHNIIRIIL